MGMEVETWIERTKMATVPVVSYRAPVRLSFSSCNGFPCRIPSVCPLNLIVIRMQIFDNIFPRAKCVFSPDWTSGLSCFHHAFLS